MKLLLLLALLALPLAAIATPPPEYSPNGEIATSWSIPADVELEFEVLIVRDFDLDCVPMLCTFNVNAPSVPAIPVTRDPAIKATCWVTYRLPWQRYCFIESIQDTDQFTSRDRRYRARDSL
tara:strand:+ start:15130 stop:15495 length:366 start_codon:yes stop_codon:yes gene_type:complete